MRFSRTNRGFWAILLSLMMSSLPQVAFASVRQEMISTVETVEALTRAQAEQRVQSYLDLPELKRALLKEGISPQEVSSRIASLSDFELKQLAGQMDQAKYGGDAGSVLVLVLLVVLIIFLVRRI